MGIIAAFTNGIQLDIQFKGGKVASPTDLKCVRLNSLRPRFGLAPNQGFSLSLMNR